MTKKEDRDIDITLPQSTSAEKLKPSDDEIVIGVSAEGELYSNGRLTSIMRLHMDLREIALLNPEQHVRLDSDELTPLHRVVEVLDLCQFNNLKNVKIRTYDDHYNRR